jgi:hypothetical protein
MKYFLRTTQTISGELTSIVHKHNNEYAHFPLSHDNIDYQEYLDWVAKGNTAEQWSEE